MRPGAIDCYHLFWFSWPVFRSASILSLPAHYCFYPVFVSEQSMKNAVIKNYNPVIRGVFLYRLIEF